VRRKSGTFLFCSFLQKKTEDKKNSIYLIESKCCFNFNLKNL
jgi:hypothetical protein